MNEHYNFTIFSKETIDKQFIQIKKELHPSMDHNIILKKFHEILHNRVILTFTYDSESEEFTIYRITNPWNGFDCNDPLSYSYNPNPTENGRAHRKGFPVFYGSIDPYTAFTEMKDDIKTNDSFYLSRWKIKFNSKTNTHPLIINSSTKNDEHILNSVIKNIHLGLKNMVREIPNEFKEGYLYSIEKLGDLFTSKGTLYYHITSAYCHQILYDLPSKKVNIPIILYPSVENNLNSINWAIHPSFVESDEMKLQDVFEMSLKENNSKSDQKNISVVIHKKGIFTENSEINWQIPVFSDFKINYSEIIVGTYNNEKLSGHNISKLNINETKKTIKNLIENNLDREKIQANLHELTSQDAENSTLNFEKKTFLWQIILQFEHGNEIETKIGKSCIRVIELPISWSRKYRNDK